MARDTTGDSLTYVLILTRTFIILLSCLCKRCFTCRVHIWDIKQHGILLYRLCFSSCSACKRSISQRQGAHCCARCFTLSLLGFSPLNDLSRWLFSLTTGEKRLLDSLRENGPHIQRQPLLLESCGCVCMLCMAALLDQEMKAYGGKLTVGPPLKRAAYVNKEFNDNQEKEKGKGS